MSLDFNAKDVKHNPSVKFVPAFLPEAKKAYNLKVVNQPVLGVHEVASKADILKIATAPKTIEDGMTSGFEIIFYLLANGCKIKTPIGTMSVSVQGEYNGSETRLPDGVFPKVRIQPSAALRKYVQQNCKLMFDGVDTRDGMIAQVTDEATEMEDETATIGNLLTIRGHGLKIDGDETAEDTVGCYFEPACEAECGGPVKARIVAVNEPKTLKVIVPEALTPGRQYRLKIITQSSAKKSGSLLKEPREVWSELTLTAQA